MSKIKKTANFIYELGQLKYIPHAGIYRAGVKYPDTVGQHVARACQIGYILAVMEKANPERVVAILAVHDNAETRIMDQDKVGSKYINRKEGEENAIKEQTEGLDRTIADNFRQYFKETEEGITKDGIVAKDADRLELAFAAKELTETGYKEAKVWIDNIKEVLRTSSAKKILAQAEKTSFTDWWKEYNVLKPKKRSGKKRSGKK